MATEEQEREGLKRLAKDVFEPRVPSNVYIKPLGQDEWQHLGKTNGDVFFFDETLEVNPERIKRQAELYKMATRSYTTLTFHAQQTSHAFMKLLFGLNWQRKPLLHNGRKATARRKK
jgi:tRNA A37 N6-isopentenylltransferase MiaA